MSSIRQSLRDAAQRLARGFGVRVGQQDQKQVPNGASAQPTARGRERPQFRAHGSTLRHQQRNAALRSFTPPPPSHFQRSRNQRPVRGQWPPQAGLGLDGKGVPADNTPTPVAAASIAGELKAAAHAIGTYGLRWGELSAMAARGQEEGNAAELRRVMDVQRSTLREAIRRTCARLFVFAERDLMRPPPGPGTALASQGGAERRASIWRLRARMRPAGIPIGAQAPAFALQRLARRFILDLSRWPSDESAQSRADNRLD